MQPARLVTKRAWPKSVLWGREMECWRWRWLGGCRCCWCCWCWCIVDTNVVCVYHINNVKWKLAVGTNYCISCCCARQESSGRDAASQSWRGVHSIGGSSSSFLTAHPCSFFHALNCFFHWRSRICPCIGEPKACSHPKSHQNQGTARVQASINSHLII